MPKLKIPRRNIALDMTAMCDMAFLLLTFFMLATKFKPAEAAVVDIPASVSQKKLPDKNLVTIWVEKDGAVFIGVDEGRVRKEMLKAMAAKHNVRFSQAELNEFAGLDAFGAPVGGLKQYLSLSKDQRKYLQNKGVPVDSINNELREWIHFALKNNSEYDFAIKGDKDVDYKVVGRVIATLQEENINKFKLITTLEL